MKKEISILIPTFNDDCYQLVEELHNQAEQIDSLRYEIIVGDDGSTSPAIVNKNLSIQDFANCIVERVEDNIGRSAIRNRLARLAQYNWLLYIDADMEVVNHDFLLNYLLLDNDKTVVYGGYYITEATPSLDNNLRYRYEQKNKRNSSSKLRNKQADKDFHTSNFLVKKEIMMNYPLNEGIRHYGYEDVLFGKTLLANNISISHIDNHVLFSSFEDNRQFVEKTDEGLRTLHLFSNELQGYSSLLTAYNKIKHLHLLPFFKQISKWLSPFLRKENIERKPPLWMFSLYKLCYFAILSDNDKKVI